MKITEIWEEQEADLIFKSGLLLRGFGGTFIPEVYVGLISPGKFRCIAASVTDTIICDIIPYENFTDIKFLISSDKKKTGNNLLIIKLVNPLHQEIFSVLCEDLIAGIAHISDESELVKELFNRFENWNALFMRMPGEQLSLEAQRGLYGELCFLRLFLQQNKDMMFSVVNSWVGPEREARDFQSGSWAVEVKTSKGNNHQKIQINGERQLDNSYLDHLFLYHLSLEVLRQSGETLNEIIEEIISVLKKDLKSLTRFSAKMVFSGYRNEDRAYYEGIGYQIRNDSFYVVEGAFPRFQETDLPKGLGDLKYSLILSACTDYLKEDSTVFNIINF